MIPQLNTCCFCARLRTGTIVILVFHVLASIIVISDLIIRKDTYDKQNDTSQTGESDADDFPTVDEIYPAGYWGTLVTSLFNGVISVVGLYGVFKNNHWCLIPYLVWKIIDVLALIGCILVLMSWVLFLTELLPLMLYVYLWLVVFSYYRVLKGSDAAEINPA